MKTISDLINLVMTLTVTIFFTSCTRTKSVLQMYSNGKKVELIEQGNGTPTIVFETGMGPMISTWDPILDSLSPHTRVYTYNRPGYGSSNLLNTPGSVLEVAKQLRMNLLEANAPPSYVLIGHSVGGLYVNMFARLYPEEVAGVIFIDSSHPEQFEYFKNHHSILYETLILSTKKGNRNYEYDIVTTALNNFIDAPKFPDVPISVLTAGKKSSPLESKKLREKWLVFQSDLANLSSDSKHTIVDGSGHYIHKNKPEIVISEILRIIN